MVAHGEQSPESGLLTVQGHVGPAADAGDVIAQVAQAPVVAHRPGLVVHDAQVLAVGPVREDQQTLSGGDEVGNLRPTVLSYAPRFGPEQHLGQPVDPAEGLTQLLCADVVLQEDGHDLLGMGGEEVHDGLHRAVEGLPWQGVRGTGEGLAVAVAQVHVAGIAVAPEADDAQPRAALVPVRVQAQAANAVVELGAHRLGLVCRTPAGILVVGEGVVGGQEGSLVESAITPARRCCAGRAPRPRRR